MASRSLVGRMRARLGCQRGTTLVELLIGSVMGVIVTGAVLSLLIVSQEQSAREVNWAHAQSATQEQLDQMVGQIRQAWNIIASGPNFVDMDVNLSGSPYQVYYECDIPSPTYSGYQECVRLQFAVGASVPSLSGAPVTIPEISNGTAASPVFTWGPSPIAPYYMTAVVDVPATGGESGSHVTLNHTIVFSDGALMRNENVQN
jgi:hypothetical protein